MKGRKPKPTSLKVLEGCRRDRINKNEPKPTPVAPGPPAWLTEEAVAVWKEFAPAMERLQLLTELDGIIFANLCQEYADMQKDQDVLNQYGPTYEYTNVKGATNIIPRPEKGMVQKSRQIIKAYCAELGLTASSRGRITLPGQVDLEDEMEAMFQERRIASKK